MSTREASPAASRDGKTRQPAEPFTVRRAQPRQRTDFQEIGTTGLRHYGGFVYEEWLRTLTGRRGAKVWREMADNDPVIGAFLFAIKMLARSVEREIEEGQDAQAAELVEECLDDMTHTWDDFISEALSILPYGWAFHEIVYKRRQGPDADPGSRFSDGKIGWRKLPIRAQETLWEWVFAEEDGAVEALVQIAYDGQRRTIPMEKGLLFRTEATRGNPEGRSVLRNAYVPWYRKKNIEEVEAIGIERDLAGIPMMAPPEGVDLDQPMYADVRRQAQDLLTAVRRDEDEGILLPQAGWKFELLTTGGSRQIDTDAIIRRYDQRIATTVLADFILLAQDRVGSYGLADIKVDTFGEAMSAWLGAIASVLNRYAIPRLLRLNGMAVDDPPQIKFGDPGKADLEQIGTFLQSLSLAGAAINWDQGLLETLFELAGLPAPEVAEPAEPADAPVAKADRDVGQALALERGPLLARALEREVAKALKEIGSEAGRIYSAVVAKAVIPTDSDRSVADKLLGALGIEQLVKDRLGPVYARHALRVARDTLQTIKRLTPTVELVTDAPDEIARRLLRDGGKRIGMLDVEKQAREAIFKALAEGRANGENPVAIARRIRQYVPAGRFTKAGSAYRAQLISRTETLHAQRFSALEAYKAAPNVTAVILRDGLLPNSDATCEARDGDEVSFDEADALMAEEHPLGTLSFSPLVA